VPVAIARKKGAKSTASAPLKFCRVAARPSIWRARQTSRSDQKRLESIRQNKYHSRSALLYLKEKSVEGIL
jgi:hypothetical protein